MKKWAGFILVLALLLLTTAAMAADLTIVTQSGTAASLSDNVWTLAGGTYTVSGSTKTESIVVTGTAKVTLNGVTIDMDESGTVIPTVSALTVRNGSVELVVKGSNVLRGVCGIQLFNSKSSVTMTGDGRITAVGSAGAGIGSRQNGTGGNITIGGTMTVWAYCAQSDAAIGSGASGSIGNISIKDNPVINARSPYEYSDNNKYVKPMTGIGSGWKGKAGNISISGGTVNAYGANGGAAIGTGLNASVGSITITGSSVVTAIATKGQLFNADGYVNTASYGMAGIGDGQLGHMTGDITIDQNSDGSVVAWGEQNGPGIGYFENGVLLQKAIDKNGDKKTQLWEAYDYIYNTGHTITINSGNVEAYSPVGTAFFFYPFFAIYDPGLPTGTDEEGNEVTFYVSGTSLSVNTGFMVTSWKDATKDKAYFDKDYSVYINDEDPDYPGLEMTSTGDVYRWIYSTIKGTVDVQPYLTPYFGSTALSGYTLVELTNLDGNTLKSSYTVNPNTVKSHDNQIYYSVAGETVYYIMKSTDTLPTADDFTARDIGFAGWYDNPECTGEPVTSVNSNSFVTYYAKFDVEANEYTVSFNMNGQSGQIFDIPSSQKVKHGKLVTKPADPYNRNQNPLFAGWYLDSACTKPYDFSTPVTKSFTLYAKWASSVKVMLMWYSDPTQTIHDDSNNMVLHVPVGNKLTVSQPNTSTRLQKDNKWFRFVQWTTDRKGTKPYDFTQAVTVDFTIYAQWIRQYAVTLHYHDSVTGTQYVDSNGKLSVPDQPSQIGYTFTGWYTDEGCTTKYNFNQSVTADLDLYAGWSPKSYTVTLHTVGGTINSGNVEEYTYGVGATLPKDVTKAYAQFGGWYSSEDYLGDALTAISVNMIGNQEFWAKWDVPEYTLTWNANGGSLTGGTAAGKVAWGTALTAPTATRTGYKFTGWSPAVPDKMPGSNAEYTAQWEANRYAVTLNVNYGTINRGDVKEYTYGVGATLPTDVTRTGYKFGGWYDNKNLTGTKVTAISATEFGDREYWAGWDANSYDVTLNPNGGDINSGNVKTYTYGVGATLPDNVTRDGYDFGGWYDNKNLTGTKVTAISATEIGSKEYWAKWEPKDYKVVLNTNGGDINSDNVTGYTCGTGATLPTDVTRTGYKFGGWYDNKDLTGTKVSSISATEFGDKEYWADWTVEQYTLTWDAAGGTLSGGTAPGKVDFGTALTAPTATRTGYDFTSWSPSVPATMPAEDLTCTAVWTASRYALTLELNGGKLNGAPATYTYGEGLTLPVPVRTGYTFLGWYSDEGFTGSAVAAIKPDETGERTFYAKWINNDDLLNRVVISSLASVPEGLQPLYPTKESLTAHMSALAKKIVDGDCVMYNVVVEVSSDGGQSWTPLVNGQTANGSMVHVVLPYPKGADSSCEFAVVHMYESTTTVHKAGDVDYPRFSKTERGLEMDLSRLSPFCVTWKKHSTPPVPRTGDSSPLAALCGLMGFSLVGLIALSSRRKNK